MADEGPRADEVEAGQRIYTPFTLRVYDLFVLGFSNRFVWRCPSSEMLGRYDSHVGARHLDVGVGTGWFLDHCTWPVESPKITLLDLNENSLSAASDRIRRYAPAAVQANVLDPVDLGDALFDSIGANFLFHCLPGGLDGRQRRSRRTSVPTSRRAGSSSEARFSAAASPTTCSDAVSCVFTTGRESSRTSRTTSWDSSKGLRPS